MASETVDVLSCPGFDGEPFFVGENGVKWWVDHLSTDYARSKRLQDLTVWAVEEADGKRARLVVRNNAEGQHILHEDHSLEGVGAWLDMLVLAEQADV